MLSGLHGSVWHPRCDRRPALLEIAPPITVSECAQVGAAHRPVRCVAWWEEEMAGVHQVLAGTVHAVRNRFM